MLGSTLTASETEVVEIKRRFDDGWKKMNVNKPVAVSRHYNKQMCWVDVADQLKSYTEVDLRFHKWTTRCVVTILQAALLNVRALWIFYTNPPLKARKMVDFTVMMFDKLLEAAGAQRAELDSRSHWLTKAHEPRDRRSWCWVCHKSRPNLTCNKCIGNPIMCLHCAEDYHSDPSCYRAYKRRRINEDEDDDEEKDDHGGPRDADEEPDEAAMIAVAQDLAAEAMLGEMEDELARDREADLNMEDI